MIEFQGVSKEYSAGVGKEQLILDNINLKVEKHEFIAILGPSGCGKTTLLNLAAGFIFPSRGRIGVAGYSVCGPGPDRGMVFQDPTLFPWLNVRDNVAFGLNLLQPPPGDLEALVDFHLEVMGLSEVKYH